MNREDVDQIAARMKVAEPMPGVPGHRSYDVAKNQHTQWAYDCTMLSDLIVRHLPEMTRHQFLVMCGVKK